MSFFPCLGVRAWLWEVSRDALGVREGWDLSEVEKPSILAKSGNPTNMYYGWAKKYELKRIERKM